MDKVRVCVHKRLSSRADRSRDEVAVTRLAGSIGVGPRTVSADTCARSLVTEYAGTALARVRPCMCVPWSDFAFWLYREARTRLTRLHEAGHLHLDVHADNWVMAPPTCRRDVPEACIAAWRAAIRDTLRLIDYGSAVALVDGVYRGPTRGGRWDLMAPEQFSMGGRDVVLSASTDMFALAAMIVELTEGRAPFHVPGKAGQARHLDHPLRRCPDKLSQWVRDRMWSHLCAPQVRDLCAALRCAPAPTKRSVPPAEPVAGQSSRCKRGRGGGAADPPHPRPEA